MANLNFRRRSMQQIQVLEDRRMMAVFPFVISQGQSNMRFSAIIVEGGRTDVVDTDAFNVAKSTRGNVRGTLNVDISSRGIRINNSTITPSTKTGDFQSRGPTNAFRANFFAREQIIVGTSLRNADAWINQDMRYVMSTSSRVALTNGQFSSTKLTGQASRGLLVANSNASNVSGSFGNASLTNVSARMGTSSTAASVLSGSPGSRQIRINVDYRLTRTISTMSVTARIVGTIVANEAATRVASPISIPTTDVTPIATRPIGLFGNTGISLKSDGKILG
jgi:hypothetical protein